LEPKKIAPADLSKAVFPPPTPDKEGKPVDRNKSFLSIAGELKIDVWDLIEFNFPGSRKKPDVVNWYLYHKMGCREMTADKLNYRFSNGMTIYFPKKKTAAPPAPVPPPSAGVIPPPPATHPFRKGWTAASVADFHAFVASTGLSWANSAVTRFDCANFAIHLLLQFAQARYLPVAFQYVNGILRCELDSIVNFKKFADDVKKKVGAPDLNNDTYPQTVALTFAATQPGDIMTQGKHVMVIFKHPSMIDVPGVLGKRRVVEILQGNLENLPYPWKEIPRDTMVQHRAYDLQIKAGYKNEGRGWEHRDDNTNLQDMLANGTKPKRWNFSWFNQVYGMPPL
jgi:hypothetical protein